MNKFERLLLFLNVETDPKVLDNLYEQSEMTKTYTALLLLANFIALFGLITNSVAVIIGAMLISPLMSPIISFGFAYITSEKRLMKLSLTTLGKSLVYVIGSAAILSYLSPLNDITEQILARTKPNLYDLFIAVFSGLVVAVSFLSKKVNAVTILTGVAIATSIIPPLSVVGFGIGTGNWSISVGAFLLFFTNFTAIVATTALSGILFGYTYFQNLKDFNYIKRRLIMILLIIAGVSLPLSYTLKQSIENIKIRRVVNQAVDGIKNATVFSINYEIEEKNHELNLNIALASGKPVTKEELLTLKTVIETKLNLKSNVAVTQVALKEDVVNNKQTIIKEKKVELPADTLSSTALKFRSKTDEMAKKLEMLMSPYPVTGYSITMDSAKNSLVTINIQKDTECAAQENDILANYISSEYKFKTKAAIKVSPLFDTIVFQVGSLDMPDTLQDFSIIGKILSKKPKEKVVITSYPESTLKYRIRKKNAETRADALKALLVEKYGLSETSIVTEMSKVSVKEPYIKIEIK